MRTAVARWGGAALGALVVASAALAADAPRTVALAWSTYLRAGPAQTSQAIAELEHDTPVEVLACSPGWCRVSAQGAQGWVDRDALVLPRTPAPVPPAGPDCVIAAQVDDRAPVPTRFCSGPNAAQPAARR